VRWLNGETIDVTDDVEEAQREHELRGWLVVRNRRTRRAVALDEARIPQA